MVLHLIFKVHVLVKEDVSILTGVMRCNEEDGLGVQQT